MTIHEKNKNLYDMTIIGSGVVGYGTAVYAGRFNLKTCIVGETPGGVITTTDIVENYPGYIRLSGLELAEKLKEHALDYKPHIETDKAVDVTKNKENIFEVETASG